MPTVLEKENTMHVVDYLESKGLTVQEILVYLGIGITLVALAWVCL